MIYQMKHKRFLQTFLDRQTKRHLQELFGEKSYVVINNISHVHSKDSYVLNVTLYVNNFDNFDVAYPHGLEMLIERAWNVVGDKKKIIVQSSFDSVQQ